MPITPAQIYRLKTRAQFRQFIETCSICPPPDSGDPYLKAVVQSLGAMRLSCHLIERAALYNLPVCR